MLLIQEMSSAVMFCNTILSKFQSESVLSDCVFACETVEVVLIAPELPCAAPALHPRWCVRFSACTGSVCVPLYLIQKDSVCMVIMH